LGKQGGYGGQGWQDWRLDLWQDWRLDLWQDWRLDLWQDWRSVQADRIFFCPKANISLSLYFGKR